MQVIYHPHAEAELLKAAQFYEKKVLGLGQTVLSEFEDAIAAILAAPERWKIIEGDIRRYLMRRFPFGIYCRIENDHMRILVVKHHSRHPEYWKYRVDS